jgi:hypothetical protein
MMAFFCCSAARLRAASAMTTALSPDSRMLTQMIFSSAMKKAALSRSMACGGGGAPVSGPGRRRASVQLRRPCNASAQKDEGPLSERPLAHAFAR